MSSAKPKDFGSSAAQTKSTKFQTDHAATTSFSANTGSRKFNFHPGVPGNKYYEGHDFYQNQNTTYVKKLSNE